MRGASKTAMALALLTLAVFGVAVHRYFHRYFDAGASGADYSSYLRGPKGARALYEALETLPEMSVSRNVRPLDRLPGGKDTALLIVGIEPWLISNEDVRLLNRFTASGGRVVIAVPDTFAEAVRTNDASAGDAPRKGEEGEKRNDGKEKGGRKACDPEKGCGAAGCDSCESLWGASFKDGKAKGAREARVAETLKDALPAAVPWRGGGWIETGDDQWRTVYTVDGKPVIAERGMGRGCVVLCADSYLFSNEALAKDRQTPLLMWMLGGARRVVFEESHLGVYEGEGVMSLALRYRLGPLLAVLAAVFALFAWKSLTSLDPGPARETSSGETWGRGSGEALAGLLRRSVPSGSLLDLCVREWRSTEPPQSPAAARLEAEVRAAAAGPDQISAYNRICAILKERRER